MLNTALYLSNVIVYNHCISNYLASVASQFINQDTWTSGRHTSDSDSWVWLNGDPVTYGLVDNPGSGPYLLISLSDYKLHAPDSTDIAAVQCEAGKHLSGQPFTNMV